MQLLCTRTGHTCIGRQTNTHRDSQKHTRGHTGSTHLQNHTHTENTHSTRADRPTQVPDTLTHNAPTHAHTQTPKGTRRPKRARTHTAHDHWHPRFPNACPSRRTLPQDAGQGAGRGWPYPRAPCRPHSLGTLTRPTEMTRPASAARAPPLRNQQPNSAATMALPPRPRRLPPALGG